MDPETALRNARDALARFRENEEKAGRIVEQLEAGGDLSDAFEALDEWLTNGGFFPKAWGTLEERAEREMRAEGQ